MEFWSLFMVASMPVLQVLIICLSGSFLASSRINILTAEALTNMNKMVFAVFGPALCFAALVKSVTIKELISWWFMMVNLGIIVFVGAFLGWIAVKILRPRGHIKGLIVATCATDNLPKLISPVKSLAGNFGYLPLIVVPALCNEKDNPFGDSSACFTNGLAYVSFSTALGAFYIWTFSYHLMRKSAMSFETTRLDSNFPEKTDEKLDKIEDDNCMEEVMLLSSSSFNRYKDEMSVPLVLGSDGTPEMPESYRRFREIVKETSDILKEVLLTPPTVSLIIGLVIGTIPWLKVLLVGDTALLGQFKIQLYSLVLAAAILGLVPQSPLFQYVLLIQFTVPPAMGLGTMAQLFGVGQEECSVILLWSYVVAAFAFTLWSTVFMWILT
ncbi:hypothetical protein LUZ61_010544 [Rhynchospora tenuis]|uniref:Uncharacterized protein n=1 Tax=Rhynchospora tenuis TaxID=198213 RepID=A0AAD6EZG9_9POAL|nr:hypothetical protein LUZ61_010544 [Rhynchospora tenuis]